MPEKGRVFRKVLLHAAGVRFQGTKPMRQRSVAVCVFRGIAIALRE